MIGAIATLFGGQASAQLGERIVDYDVDIAIGDDGVLTIVETIDYDFGAAERHGILRDIPTRLRYDDTYDRIYPLEVVEVRASEGTPAEYEVESAPGGITRIRVGDADVEITGRHAYELTYTVEAALNGVPRSRRAVLERDRHGVVGADRAGDRPRARTRGHHAGRMLPGVRGLDAAVRPGPSDGPEARFAAVRARFVRAVSRSSWGCRRVPSSRRRPRSSRSDGRSAVRSRRPPPPQAEPARSGSRRSAAWWRSSGAGDATGATAARRSTRSWATRRETNRPCRSARPMHRHPSSSRRPTTCDPARWAR